MLIPLANPSFFLPLASEASRFFLLFVVFVGVCMVSLAKAH
jgi:hypothetical protein